MRRTLGGEIGIPGAGRGPGHPHAAGARLTGKQSGGTGIWAWAGRWDDSVESGAVLQRMTPITALGRE